MTTWNGPQIWNSKCLHNFKQDPTAQQLPLKSFFFSRRGIVLKHRLFRGGRLSALTLQVHPGRLLVGGGHHDHSGIRRHDVSQSSSSEYFIGVLDGGLISPRVSIIVENYSSRVDEKQVFSHALAVSARYLLEMFVSRIFEAGGFSLQEIRSSRLHCAKKTSGKQLWYESVWTHIPLYPGNLFSLFLCKKSKL